jgi:anti-sigma factor RsiW
MSDHLSLDLLNALADGELSANQLASANDHLAKCPACTSSALYQSLLKSATARAGQRYTLSPQLQERLARLTRQEENPSTSWSSRRALQPMWGPGFAGWATAFALLLILGSVFVLERSVRRNAMASSEFAALVTEVSDQHVSTLASNAPPQVLSSDRHTVKPWFQGKLPFSFNLPENLPSDTRLEGANLTYLHNEPAALLLYSVGKHRVSVFVRERRGVNLSQAISADHAGFHVAGFSTNDLEVVAVSDVDPARLSELLNALRQVQAGERK